MMNPRIGFLTYALERAAGGIGRYTRDLSAALCEAGAALTFLHAGGGGLPGGHTLRGSHLLPGLLTVGQAEIARVVRQQRLNVVHDPTGVVPLLLARAARVVTIHDVIPYIYPQTSSSLDWLIYRFWLPLAVRRVDAVITVSQQSKRDLLRFLPVPPDRVTVIAEAARPEYAPMPAGVVQQALERYGIQFPYLLYVGSIEARKNLATLLEAYARLPGALRRWKLVLVGPRKWKSSSVYETLRRHDLEADVHFTGFVADEDLPALYNGADLFVFPSLYEGFGLPVLEAMGCGAPVITSNVSSLPEVAGDAALLVSPQDVDGLAQAIQRVLTDGDLARDLRARGLARAAAFSWQRAAQETLAVYQQVGEGV